MAKTKTAYDLWMEANTKPKTLPNTGGTATAKPLPNTGATPTVKNFNGAGSSVVAQSANVTPTQAPTSNVGGVAVPKEWDSWSPETQQAWMTYQGQIRGDRADLTNAYNSTVQALDSSIPTIQAQYAKAKESTKYNYGQQGADIDTRMTGAGLRNTTYAVDRQVQNDYRESGALNELTAQEATALTDVENRKSQLKAEYDTAIKNINETGRGNIQSRAMQLRAEKQQIKEQQAIDLAKLEQDQAKIDLDNQKYNNSLKQWQANYDLNVAKAKQAQSNWQQNQALKTWVAQNPKPTATTTNNGFKPIENDAWGGQTDGKVTRFTIKDPTTSASRNLDFEVNNKDVIAFKVAMGDIAKFLNGDTQHGSTQGSALDFRTYQKQVPVLDTDGNPKMQNGKPLMKTITVKYNPNYNKNSDPIERIQDDDLKYALRRIAGLIGEPFKGVV